jgi:hypothetical protein
MDQAEELYLPLTDVTAYKNIDVPNVMAPKLKPKLKPKRSSESVLLRRSQICDPAYPSSEMINRIAEKLLDQLWFD